MGKAGGVVVVIVSVFLLLGPFREPISDGIKGWRTISATESASVTTISIQTSANVTLDYDLYQAATAEIITITSNVTGDSPVAASYVEATKLLLVSGLLPSQTHTLTLNYYAETDDDVMRSLGPFLGLLIFGGIIFLIFWKAKK